MTTQQLYSIKSGVLKPLKPNNKRGWPHHKTPFWEGYRVSVNGHKRRLELSYLQKLWPVVEFEYVGVE